MRRRIIAGVICVAASAIVHAGVGPVSADTPRTVPDPACAPAYLGTTGVIGMPPEPGLGMRPTDGGDPAPPEIAAVLPETIAFRDNTTTFNRTHEFALQDGNIFVRAVSAPGEWRQMLLPVCLDGNVTGISADGDTLVATDRERWLYTVSLSKPSPAGAGWTRRWGPFFWADLGMQIPADVRTWAASDLSATEDGSFRDRAGNDHVPFGILTLYLLRGDGRTITTLDPWLPSDVSREVCTPNRGTTQIAGLSGSGSTVVIVDRAGRIFTRLYEFDVAGANTVFYDYAWEDQSGVKQPRVQLPAPDWVAQPAVPGRITDRVALSKIFTMPSGRLIRIEGLDAAGNTGYWQKDASAGSWTFVRTDAPLIGRSLPLPQGTLFPEDLTYSSSAEGYPAQVLGFNPYCSPSTIRFHLPEGVSFDLILHSIDGLRQERRGRGIDGDARGYRSAVEVPLETWENRESLPMSARLLIQDWFPKSRFLDGPLTVTRTHLVVGVPCWNFFRGDAVEDSIPSATRDLGAIFAGLMAAQEEDRYPSTCTGQQGAL